MPHDGCSNLPWCECPCCGLRSEGEEEIIRNFGYRNLGD
jgi:hypothetical protein